MQHAGTQSHPISLLIGLILASIELFDRCAAVFGAVFHFAWVIVICVSGKDILTLPDQCHHAGKQVSDIVPFSCQTFILWPTTGSHTLHIADYWPSLYHIRL